MRTAHLLFRDNQLLIVSGIKVVSTHNSSNMHMYVNEGRDLAMPIVAARPPLVVPSRDASDPSAASIALLSLIATNNCLWMAEEYNQREQVLLFVDTLDPSGDGSIGQYLLPVGHDVRLPYVRQGSTRKQSTYGLVVLGPGESLLVQSTRGSRTKLWLNEKSRFSNTPCGPTDHLLLDSPPSNPFQ